MKRAIYFLLVITLIMSGCREDDGDSVIVTDEKSLTQRLEDILSQSNFPGLSVGIVKNGTPVYQRSFGFKNIEENVAYTNQTIQPIASISKSFIGVAVVKCIELGYFTLDTPINDILYEDLVNPKNPSAEILVRHLVNHTSGIVDTEEFYISSYYILSGQNMSSAGAQMFQAYGITQREPRTLEEFITSYFYEGGSYYSPDNFMNTDPGEREIYSNTGASLMAYMIAKASGMSFRDFMSTYVFNPLGMDNTSYQYKLPNDNYATLYWDKETPLPFYDFDSFPDGGIKTSNEDMMKYMVNMMAGARGETNTLFSEEHYKLLFSETSPTYTVFWDVDPGENAFGSRGGDIGTTTELHFSAKHNAGFFTLSNYDEVSADSHGEHYDEVMDQINESINEFFAN
ncbi:serine hydrolase domain-containing protein [Fulvivirga kasyanovii]|uniref:Class A beta-lactamase-related serine hydrolase n=1 Tax=Fulvivirga kasyanovii TaxID=396812 RepID=A0ABW9RW30_9BACT|nr:serine hydrolase domain-containing protein [Fulvivirga kasyanovii]MTI27210.1 class A beta-lactamase-related serine hydrolase [Fulvivirga kasyanovii]